MANDVRKRITDWFLGIGLAIVTFLGASEGVRLYQVNTHHSASAAAYLEPIQLVVPDHVAGSNPVLFYDREIRQDFVGQWIVEMQRIQADGSPISICTGSGTNLYSPEKTQPEEGTTLSWFMGKLCAVPAGTYRLVANWTIDRPGIPGVASASLHSNLFEVSAQ
jgi:hypothetical protein